MRDRCVNALHVAMCVHSEERYLRTSRIILFSTASLRQWYSEHAKGLRTPEANHTFTLGMVHGSGVLGSLDDITKPFSDLQQLQQLGFCVDELTSHACFRAMPMDAPMLLDQLGLAEQVAEYMFALLRRRVMSLSTYMCLYPYKFALLIHPDPHVVHQALSNCKAANDCWKTIQQQTSAH